MATNTTTTTTQRIFLLSPARLDGKRAGLVYNENARFDLARRLRSPAGATVGDVFSFLSGLYFRGKLAYARAFAPTSASVFVITSNRGLIGCETAVTLDDLQRMGEIPIDLDEPRYRKPLERSARALRGRIGPSAEVVLLGSVASGKYVDVFLDIFGERLFFPTAFVGRGDMSRGGLMLRCVDAMCELDYAPVTGAVRNGTRPPRLKPRV